MGKKKKKEKRAPTPLQPLKIRHRRIILNATAGNSRRIIGDGGNTLLAEVAI